MNENEMAQVLALMNQYARILTELNDRHVVCTYNSPVGDFGEWLVAQKLGLTLERNSAKGLDAIGPDGLRYQIKCRWERSDHPTVSSRELSVIRNLDENQFDYLIVVIFDRSFCIKEAYSIPHDIIQRYALYRRHVNGHILLANGPVLEDAAVENITHRLRYPATGRRPGGGAADGERSSPEPPVRRRPAARIPGLPRGVRRQA